MMARQKQLWECPSCGARWRSDNVCGDDFDEPDGWVGPTCEICEEYAECVNEETPEMDS